MVGPPGRLHLGRDRGHQRGRLGCHPCRARRARALRRRRALGRPRRLGPRRADRGRSRVDGTGGSTSRPSGSACGRRTAPPRAGALPVGQPRGGHAPTRARGRRALPRRRRHGARRRRRGVRPRADGPGRARRRPGQRQRAQARGRARRRCADRPARQPVRAAPRRRRAGARAPGRARAHPGAPRLRRRGRRAGRRRAAADRDRGRDRPAPDRRRRRRGAGGRRGRGRRARRAEDRLPHLVCLGVHGVEAEPVLIGLDRAGVAVHSGSACSSESIEPSPVLEAMGVDPSHSLRVSVGWTTTDEDCAAFADAFTRVVRRPAGATGLTTSRSTPRVNAGGTAAPRRPCRRRRRAAPPGAARRPGGPSARKSLNWVTAAAWLWSWFSRTRP